MLKLVFKDREVVVNITHRLMLWFVSFQENAASVGHLFGQYVDSDLVNSYCIIFWLNRA